MHLESQFLKKPYKLIDYSHGFPLDEIELIDEKVYFFFLSKNILKKANLIRELLYHKKNFWLII
jgi:hypothetical protein